MATLRTSAKFRDAARDYLHDEQFSDFTIVCEQKEFKVHRCFISAHSPFFKKCCSGMFEVRFILLLETFHVNTWLTAMHRKAKPIESNLKKT